MVAISFAPILVRYSDAPVSVQGMYRMLFTFLLMLPFSRKQLPAVRNVSVKNWLLLVLAGLFLGLHFLLWMASLNYTSIASSTIILSLEPVLVMAGAYFIYKDRSSRKAVLGMLIALVGAVGIGFGDIGLSHRAFMGDFLSLLSAVAIAVNMLIAKKIMEQVPAYLYSWVVFGITFCFFAGYNLVQGIPFGGYPSKDWVLFLLLAIVPTVFGHLIFNWLLTYVKAATVSMSVLAEPVGSSILAIFLFGEMISSFQLAGGALIIIGLLLYLRSEQSEAKEKTESDVHRADSPLAS
ncbi:DMT family transporter [Paenibacillus protaetiae]|uniref:DMT family transporter n=1 Tax=Paenibacillus protaetiae TaxID=2509456 RepID=A0A4P6F6D8_9BACL|nr:DMT family transporter [Paenibacillus protaetiae]QAY65978.1 DMT family transporter [Paenibacillus protaetiae]